MHGPDHEEVVTNSSPTPTWQHARQMLWATNAPSYFGPCTSLVQAMVKQASLSEELPVFAPATRQSQDPRPHSP